MHKKILFTILMIPLLTGLYGCSCSERATDAPEVEPGLYIKGGTGSLSLADGVISLNEGATPTLNVTLQRDNNERITVEYEILSSNSETRALAIVGSGDDADVRAATDNNILTFDGSTSDTLIIPLTIIDDDVYELDEVFIVRLKGASAGVSIIEGQVEVVLKNDDPAPTGSIELADVNSSSVLNEALVQRVGLKVTLDKTSDVDATLSIERSIERSSEAGMIAAYRIDYMLFQGENRLMDDAEFVIPAGELELTFDVEVIDDGIREQLEKFDLILGGRSHITIEGETKFSFSIMDNDTAETVVKQKLNDTGVIDLPFNSFVLSDAETDQADSNFGRDSDLTQPKVGGGRASFDFSKISATGEVMPIDASFTETPWTCVRDNTTGLLWEVKLRDETTSRGVGRTFNWYDPSYATNGGVPGAKGAYLCDGTSPAAPCNTAYYIADTNLGNGLCGVTGWRLPTIEELRSLLDYNALFRSNGTTFTTTLLPAYDTDYFAGDLGANAFILSSTTVADRLNEVWAIKFGNKMEEGRIKSNSTLNGVRLVNDSPLTSPQLQEE